MNYSHINHILSTQQPYVTNEYSIGQNRKYFHYHRKHFHQNSAILGTDIVLFQVVLKNRINKRMDGLIDERQIDNRQIDTDLL